MAMEYPELTYDVEAAGLGERKFLVRETATLTGNGVSHTSDVLRTWTRPAADAIVAALTLDQAVEKAERTAE